jgi:hemerythrin superfamily protein
MATPNDPASTRRRPGPGAYPVDHPLDALRRDHDLLRHLAAAYEYDDSMSARRHAVGQLLQALETHSRLEQAVFYPAVRDMDATLIGHFDDEHHYTDDMATAIRRMSDADPQCEAMVRNLIDATLRHIREEEEQLFPKLEAARMDMTPIGLQMQAFEANLVHMAAQASYRQPRR